jgi:uncharacterized ParB-like nuclease family protein
MDSGINALSVIERFAPPVERTSLRRLGTNSQSIFEGTFRCQAGDQQLTATVLTSWYSTAPARSTRIRYASGAELVMDHHAVAAYTLDQGRVSAMFGSLAGNLASTTTTHRTSPDTPLHAPPLTCGG